MPSKSHLSLSILLTVVATNILCENTKYDMNNLASDHLLRGSSDDRDKITQEDIDKLSTELKDLKQLQLDVQKLREIEKSETTVNYEDNSTEDKTEKETTTTEAKMIGIPDEMADTDTTIFDDVEESETETKDVTGRTDTTTVEDKEETTTAADSSVADAESLSNETEGAADEAAGLRNPKTDTSDNQPINTRTYDAKPRPQAELSRSSTLRSWLEDSWLRSPPGILVPLRPSALQRALAVWNDLVENEIINVSDIVIIGYDSNGVNWRSRHNLQGSPNGNGAVAEALAKLALKYQGVFSTEVTGDGTMRALSTAAKMVPYDSALFVVTDRGAADGQRLPLALRALVEKRLKVYTIWTDPRYPSPASEEDLLTLRNVSEHTEGDVLPYSLDKTPSDAEDLSSQMEMEPESKPQGRSARLNTYMDDKMETLLVRRGSGAALSVGVPVESGVSGLRVLIEGAVQHAVIYPPNDEPQIDLYNATSVGHFSPYSRVQGLSPRDVYLAFPGSQRGHDQFKVIPMESNSDEPEPYSGTWHLSVKCDSCDYRLTVYAHARIHFDAGFLNNDTLNLRVSGPMYTVRETTLVDEYGNELSKLPFSYQPASALSVNSPPPPSYQDMAVDVAYPQISTDKVYVKIVGRDLKGESYVRLSGPLSKTAETRSSRSAAYAISETGLELTEPSTAYERRLNNTYVLGNGRTSAQIVNQLGTLLTAVQIGLSSRLYGAPGDSLQLHFEVTNYREQSVYFRFEAVGELRFLRGITPTAQTIASGQTVNVIVSVTINSNAVVGARDLITFTAYGTGYEQVSLAAYVYVSAPDLTVTDVSPPQVWHTIQGSCWGTSLDSDCGSRTWTADVSARDSQGGLLRLSSLPIGIIYDSAFVAGSRETVTATYRATCCAPRVVFTAVDAYGNAYSYVVDVSNYIAPAGIAAIVLGVLLFIALIALIVFLIVWCVRRRRASAELPSYATNRSSRKEIS